MNIIETLKMLKSQLEGISGNWNGDESGIAEERAGAAEEGIKKIEELEIIFSELNIL